MSNFALRMPDSLHAYAKNMATEPRSKAKPTKAKSTATASTTTAPATSKAAAKTAAAPSLKGNGKVAPTATPSAAATHQPSGPGEVLGEVVWLMTQSAAHKHLFLADLEWLVMPPITHRQFRLFREADKPLAFACWALVNEETERRLLTGQQRLRPDEWQSGDRAWIIAVIAPFGNAEAAFANLKQTIFKDHRLMALQPRPDGKGMAAVEVKLVANAAATQPAAK